MNQVIISPLNGIRFVPAGVTPKDRYNRQQFDNEWYYDLIYNFQEKVFFAQPIQSKDYLSLQVLANKDATLALKLIDCNGITKKSETLTKIANSPDPSINGVSCAYFSFFGINFWGFLDSGIYYLTIESTFADGNTSLFLSEPLEIKDRHTNTVLIEYQNTYNKDNILFEQTYQKFCCRVPGAMKLKPVNTKTVFQDQGYSSVLLSGTAYRQWDFKFGGQGKYLPEYMFDMLNHIFMVDKIKIDGKQFTAIEDTNLELDDVDLYPLTAAKISLGEAENMDSFAHKSGQLLIAQIPSSGFVLWSLNIGKSGFVDYHYENPIFAPNASGVQTLILLYLNPSLSAQGLTGSFSVYTDPATSNQYLAYNLGSDESFNEGSWEILTESFGTTMTTAQSFYTAKPKYEFKGNGNKIAFVDNTQNNTYGYGIVNGTTEIECTGFILQQQSRTMRVFYNEPTPLSYIKISDEPSIITPFLNLSLTNLEEIIVTGATAMNTFSIYDVLMPSKDTLFRVQITNSGLTSLGVVVPTSGTPTKLWKRLKEFYLFGNQISLTPSPNPADDFIININRYASLYYGGDTQYAMNGLVLISGSPASPYTSASQTARDNLTQNYGWSIH